MNIDFNINADNIEKSELLTEIEFKRFMEQIKIDLPPSFIDFKTKFADSFYISTGNALSILPLIENKDMFTNVVSITNDYAHLGNVLNSHKLLIFGMSGLDSETWAFYVDKKYSDGGYPIVWISPAEERFFFHSTNFESFLNIQYKSLTDLDENDSYDESYENLVKKYDKQINPFGYNSIYSNAHDLNDLELIMSQI
jgi:hypothetical protein